MKQFDYEIVKNPEILQENRLPSHSNHVSSANWFDVEDNSHRMSLEGFWKYDYAKDMTLAVHGFEEADYSCKSWEDISVPSAISIESVSPFSMEEGVASYVKYFVLPEHMRGERLCISFQGVGGSLALWLNGEYVGYSRACIGAVEFELTPYMTAGENKLAVRIWKQEEDNCPFFGLYREVYVYMVPAVHLWDVRLETAVSEDFSEGMLKVTATSCGEGEVEISLLDPAMQEVVSGIMPLKAVEGQGCDYAENSIAGSFAMPMLWNAETPNLYVLQMEVRDCYGDLMEAVSIQTGFRQLEHRTSSEAACVHELVVKEDCECPLYREEGGWILNGKPLILKALHHEQFCRDWTQVSTQEAIEQDVLTMKRYNVNAVYTSAGWENPFLYDLCDKYGIYVITDGGWERDKNHPCILSYEGAFYGGEDEIADKQNCVYGVDKNPLPWMQAFKYQNQDIVISFAERTFTVQNRHLFTNTNAYAASILLQKDGRDMAKMPLDIAVEPLSKQEFEIPAPLQNAMDHLKMGDAVSGHESEFAITVSFLLKTNTLWEKAGYETAFGQKIHKGEVMPYSCEEDFGLFEKNNGILLKGAHFEVFFSDYGLESYVYGGKELFRNIPKPNFWQVPNLLESRQIQKISQWKTASMYGTARPEKLPANVAVLDDCVQVMYTIFLPTVPEHICYVIYRVFGDGTIETTLDYEIIPELGEMPEFGMLFQLDAVHNRIKWYGLGPDETDGNGLKLGIYEAGITDSLKRYRIPQECGKRSGVRYAQIVDKQGRGLLIFGDELQISALPYTPHELENASCPDELPPVNYTVVRVAQPQDVKAKMQKEQDLTGGLARKIFTFCFRGTII